METIQDLIDNMRSFGDQTAISWKSGSYSFEELHRRADAYARGLHALGLRKGDRVALFADNIPEWLPLNCGIVYGGMVDVPRGLDSTPQELAYILEHSEAKAAIVQMDACIPEMTSSLESIISIQPAEGYMDASELVEMGSDGSQMPSVDLSDTASIIYTSGTTGAPKGVELTHGNFISNVSAIQRHIDIGEDDKLVSILPPWHVFERIIKYTAASCGAETFYSTRMTLLDDLRNEEPTIFASVPRIWKLIYDRVAKNINKLSQPKRWFISKSIDVAKDYAIRDDGIVKTIERPLYAIADKAVFSTLRSRLGGRFRFAVSGGGALPPYIEEFFTAAGIEILEGYGLTETSPVIAARVPGQGMSYSVGKLMDNLEAKIVDPETGIQKDDGGEGLLYVKGPSVMKGYFRDSQATQDICDDEGYLNTGDLAYFKGDKLVITGREKDIIVLSNGENINPQRIEETLAQSPYISMAIAVGQDWPSLGALIVPDQEILRAYRQEHDIDADSKEEYDLFRKEIRSLTQDMRIDERIRQFRILPYEFEVGRELTPTLKPKRNVINGLYKEYLDDMDRCMR